MLTVLVDVDDTLVDTTPMFLEGLEATSGVKRYYADIAQWDLKTALGITAEQERLAWEYVGQGHPSDIPGALEAVSRIADAHNVIFVTSPHRTVRDWAHMRQTWLEERFPGVPIVHTREKQIIPGHVIIDDNPENVRMWRTEHRGLGIVFAAPWNRQVRLGDSVCRTNSWSIIEKLLSSVEKTTESTRIAEMRCP